MLQNSDRSRQTSNEADRLSDLTKTFTRPDDVLHSRVLGDPEKRAILAAWASDAHAVPNLPAMRQLESGAIVDIDAVLSALRTLDEREPPEPPPGSRRRIGHGPRFTLATRWYRRHRGDDGGDDPPPCPAAALPPGVKLELRRRGAETWQLAAA